mmetsp:Transcript_560/g.903  ORF Transcript_560/g.903 Transcript_560/m.903 type:complete len:201 (+) Transcript_560:370-972(+)
MGSVRHGSEGPPHPSNEGYAYSKRMLECLVRYYRQAHQREWLCVIPTNIYGPHDNFSLQDGHVVPALIHKCYVASRDQTAFTVAGSGKPLRQFVYSEDLARAIISFLQKDHCKKNSSVIVCPDDGDELSIEEVASTIAGAFGFSGAVELDPSRADGIFRKTASNLELRRLLGEEFRFTSFADGISKTVEWFRDNFEDCRK